MRPGALALALLAGCSGEAPPPRRAIPEVCTTFYPATYFAARIGGTRIAVVCPVPPEADPALWMPDAASIRRYQQADLIVTNGADFEKWVGKVSLPLSRVVETARPLAKDLLRHEGAVTHSHGPGGAHSHKGIDGHTWLDPNLAAIQASEIHKGLVRLLPGHVTELNANWTALSADLIQLDEALDELTKAIGDRPLLAAHPAWNYLARGYGWKVVNFDLSPGKAPDEAAAARLREVLKEKPARVALWESEPGLEVAAALEKAGLKSVVFSPCESPPTGDDYLGVMRKNIARLRAALSE